jgi:LPXTG-motif cell wall-anchored protein
MIALGGAMMFMPSSTFVGAGDITPPTDPCELPQDAVVETLPPECCPPVEGPTIIDPCIVDTVPDTVVDTSPDTTDLAGSGGQIPATGTSTNTWVIVLIGGALVLSGSGLLVAGRRRNPTPN